MISEFVNVADLRPRRLLLVLVRLEVVLLYVEILEFLLQGIEAEHAHVDVEVVELLLQLLHVPGRELGDLIVREPEGADLVVGEVVGPYRRDGCQAEFLRGAESCVSGDDDIVPVDYDRNLEAEGADAEGDLVDGLVVVPRVVLVRDQILDPLFFNSHVFRLPPLWILVSRYILRPRHAVFVWQHLRHARQTMLSRSRAALEPF